ncbi:hypothetical protein MTQ01_13025 [Streptomyces sp. XM4193]|uniref:endonuclease/exonuclease/phosphatase family protein n=1 Tax=Streptomyces sp. XM4193 TaxID=2929782 RepID=UPI001FF70AC3|nr:endonuclease/exonuclease/phosphatase family protein [Streptomyces sp. XM4193]MCK1796920.1 hypothetical protein [Streptomyces sp. XM4193]
MNKPRMTLIVSVAIPMASLVALAAVPAGAAPPQEADGSPGAEAAVTMTVGTHNVLRGKAEYRPFADVIGWQEVQDPQDRERLRKKLGGYGHFMPGKNPARQVPISWRKDTFEFVKGAAELTHKGEAKVTPNRYVVWAVLKHKKTNKRLVAMNTHFISGAWNKHPNRQARWLTHAEKLRKTVGNLHQKHPDLPIFLVGDFNRRKALKLPAGVDYIRVEGVKGVPIDQSYATGSVNNSKVKRLQKFGSDHHAYRFTATF